MLIYLKGVSKAELEPVLDFLYNGEAFVAQEKLKLFIKTGKDLQVKGLEGELSGVDENVSEELNKHQVREGLVPEQINAGSNPLFPLHKTVRDSSVL